MASEEKGADYLDSGFWQIDLPSNAFADEYVRIMVLEEDRFQFIQLLQRKSRPVPSLKS